MKMYISIDIMEWAYKSITMATGDLYSIVTRSKANCCGKPPGLEDQFPIHRPGANRNCNARLPVVYDHLFWTFPCVKLYHRLPFVSIRVITFPCFKLCYHLPLSRTGSNRKRKHTHTHTHTKQNILETIHPWRDCYQQWFTYHRQLPQLQNLINIIDNLNIYIYIYIYIHTQIRNKASGI